MSPSKTSLLQILLVMRCIKLTLLVIIVTIAHVYASFVSYPRTTSGMTIIEPAELSGMNIPISYAQFAKLPEIFGGLEGFVTLSDPIMACQPLKNLDIVKDTIVLVDRGECEFYSKALHLEKAGAIGFLIANVLDNSLPSPTWGLAGVTREVPIPGGALYGRDAAVLRRLIAGGVPVRVRLAPVHLFGSELP